MFRDSLQQHASQTVEAAITRVSASSSHRHSTTCLQCFPPEAVNHYQHWIKRSSHKVGVDILLISMSNILGLLCTARAWYSVIISYMYNVYLYIHIYLYFFVCYWSHILSTNSFSILPSSAPTVFPATGPGLLFPWGWVPSGHLPWIEAQRASGLETMEKMRKEIFEKKYMKKCGKV